MQGSPATTLQQFPLLKSMGLDGLQAGLMGLFGIGAVDAPRQFRERRKLRLQADRGSFGIDAGGEIIQRDLDDVAADLADVVRVVGQRLHVGEQQNCSWLS